MQTQEILRDARELKETVIKAMELVRRMKSHLPAMEEPAMNAQCSVIHAFLNQSVHHEQRLEEMLSLKSTS